MKILYICTHNRCRSILSEGITNHLSQGKLLARSAGSQPSGEVHPLSLHFLKQQAVDIQGLESQSWDDLESFEPELVITVCDNAAGETCPLWFSRAVKIHWGLADPSKLQGSDEMKQQAFEACIDEIKQRVEQMLTWVNQSLSAEEIAWQVQAQSLAGGDTYGTF